jgi:ferritin-like metal-binding protein YciE
MSSLQTVKDLLIAEIKDLYSAEKQLTNAIPKMVKGSNDPALKAAFEAHLAETVEQLSRLEEAASILGAKPTGKKCLGMEGITQEGGEALQAKGEEAILDLGIIGAGSRVEHYEISGYMTAIGLAQQIGSSEVVSLLQQSLKEEQGAEETLRKLAGGLLKSATRATAAAV